MAIQWGIVRPFPTDQPFHLRLILPTRLFGQQLVVNQLELQIIKSRILLASPESKLPDFDIYNLSGCRLTWQELSILNLMAQSYQAAGEQGTATLASILDSLDALHSPRQRVCWEIFCSVRSSLIKSPKV